MRTKISDNKSLKDLGLAVFAPLTFLGSKVHNRAIEYKEITCANKSKYSIIYGWYILNCLIQINKWSNVNVVHVKVNNK